MNVYFTTNGDGWTIFSLCVVAVALSTTSIPIGKKMLQKSIQQWMFLFFEQKAQIGSEMFFFLKKISKAAKEYSFLS